MLFFIKKHVYFGISTLYEWTSQCSNFSIRLLVHNCFTVTRFVSLIQVQFDLNYCRFTFFTMYLPISIIHVYVIFDFCYTRPYHVRPNYGHNVREAMLLARPFYPKRYFNRLYSNTISSKLKENIIAHRWWDIYEIISAKMCFYIKKNKKNETHYVVPFNLRPGATVPLDSPLDPSRCHVSGRFLLARDLQIRSVFASGKFRFIEVHRAR